MAVLLGTKGSRRRRSQTTSVREEAASHLRGIFGPTILVMSGQRRRMYQSLAPKPEGTIFSKRSSLRGQTELLTTRPPL
jgi:hypothetical protein